MACLHGVARPKARSKAPLRDWGTQVSLPWHSARSRFSGSPSGRVKESAERSSLSALEFQLGPWAATSRGAVSDNRKPTVQVETTRASLEVLRIGKAWPRFQESSHQRR